MGTRYKSIKKREGQTLLLNLRPVANVSWVLAASVAKKKISDDLNPGQNKFLN